MKHFVKGYRFTLNYISFNIFTHMYASLINSNNDSNSRTFVPIAFFGYSLKVEVIDIKKNI